MSYSKKIPVDENRSPDVFCPPAVLALQRFVASGATSSVITFHDDATNLEIAATNVNQAAGGLLMKWIATTDTQASVTTANFDHYIASTQSPRRFVIPKETIGTASLVGVNIKEGLYRRVAWVAHGASSVVATTY